MARIPSCASSAFWRVYRQLPANVRALADKNFALLKQDPKHPSLHFNRSAAIGPCASERIIALSGVDVDDAVLWFWIGSHADYDRLIG